MGAALRHGWSIWMIISFIKDLNGVEKYFFHVNNVVGNIVENNIVTFDLERGTKGMNAVNICLEKQ